MSEVSIEELRRLAMAAIPMDETARSVMAQALDPDTVLALLERCERAEAEHKRLDGICTTLAHLTKSDHDARMKRLLEHSAACDERDQLRADLAESEKKAASWKNEAARIATERRDVEMRAIHERDEALRQLAAAQTDLAEARMGRDELHREAKAVVDIAIDEVKLPVRFALGGDAPSRAMREVAAQLATTQAALSETRSVLVSAQTALYDAMHAGHLSRAYHDSIADKIDTVLAADTATAAHQGGQ